MEGKENNKKTGIPAAKDGDSSFLQSKQARENPFTLPNGYFDSLPGRIQDKVHSKGDAPVRPFPRSILLAASAAAILVIVAFTLFLKSEYDNSAKRLLLSNNSNTIKEMESHQAADPMDADSNKKVTPLVNKPGETQTQAMKPARNIDPGENKKDNIVLQKLDKEGISDEDILQYLIEENYDPSEIIN